MARRRPEPASAPPSPAAPSRTLFVAILVAAIALGLAARWISLSYAPRYSYPQDHKDFMAWADEAWRSGPHNLYARARPWYINYEFHLQDRAGQWQTRAWPTAIPHTYNYLPGSGYLLWAQGALWAALDEEQTLTSPRAPQLARLTQAPPRTQHTSRVANTPTARFVAALPGMLLDLVLACGVAALVAGLRGAPRWGVPEALGLALTLLSPPIFLDSSFWNQVDSWVAAPLVWTMAFLLRDRFKLAGLAYGAALVLKPQAILLGPVLAFVAVALWWGPGGSLRRAARMLWVGAVALLVAFLIALPHTLAARSIPVDQLPEGDRPWHALLWFKRGYVDTVAGDLYPRVTLNAFNIWWLDWLAWGGDEAALNSEARVFGVSKDTLGKLLLAAGILVGAALCARKWRWRPASWVACAFVVTFCAFMLPTRVHERYIYLCIPFLIALAAWRPRVWLAPLAALLIVGTAEMTSFRWAHRPDTRSVSVLMSLLAIGAFVYTFAALIPRAPAESKP